MNDKNIKIYQVRVHSNGDTFWYNGDNLHNETGPAIVWGDGREPEYYLNNEELTKKEWKKRIRA
jgi:hypothetical protein